MDFSTKETLSRLFQRIVQWKMTFDRDQQQMKIEGASKSTDHHQLIDEEIKIPWSAEQLLLVGSYVLKFNFNSDLSTLLCDSITKSSPLYLVELLDCPNTTYTKVAKKIVAFTDNLKVFFMMPKVRDQSSSSDHKKHELVSAFISFLLQLLYNSITDLIVSDQIKSLQKELRFLVTILGDTSLLLGGRVIEENILAEFEAVANEAGSLVHSFIFTVDLNARRIHDEVLGALLEHIDVLKGNIMGSFSNLQNLYIVKTYNIVDSLFIIDSVLHDLEDLLIMNGGVDKNLTVDVKDQIVILHEWLMVSQPFLKDIINVAPYSEIEELREHVMRIRDTSYETEYLINSFLVGDAPLSYLTIRLPRIIDKIKLIGTQLREMKKNFDLGSLKFAKDFSAQLSLQDKRNSEVVDNIIVGVEGKAVEILDQLVGGTERLEIITIFGMPGLGKTTLAKKLYDHPTVNYRFDKRSWCVVSHTCERKILLITILISLGSNLDRAELLSMKEERLAERMYKTLKERRYLIVVDDIWDSIVWYGLRRYFPDDGNGSRILFTSRNKDVAPPGSIIHALPSLSNDQCWELLEKKVFHNKPCPPKLLGIGKQIATKCSGLPLAVVVTAGILSTMDKEESTWEKVGASLATYIFADRNNFVMQILELSYKQLPDYLKPCFLYFGAFPEDKEISAGKLMRLWIAEGFVGEKERKSSESVAEEYLMELVDKSLVIVVKRRSDGGVKTCVLHDLWRDLCSKRAEEENFLKLTGNNKYNSIYTNHQRLHSPLGYVVPNKKNGQIYVTSLLPLGPYGRHVRSFFGYLLDSPFYVLNMKLLRVLDCWSKLVHEYDDHDRMAGIEYLVHLKYLAINRMPPSISSLVNLEFLLMNDQVLISSSILKMVKLKYLKAREARFDQDCISSSQRTNNNLQTLSTIEIYDVTDEEILKCSPNLRKLKCRCVPLLIDTEEGEEKSSYRYPDLCFLNQLESLHMRSFYVGGEVDAEISFPSNIKKLTLSTLSLPWEKMSTVGELPNLEVLKLESDAFLGERWETRDGEFQKLRFLKLNGFTKLAEWNVSSSEHFPKLQQLKLRGCYNLEEIPCEIGEIVTLQLIEVDWCWQSVAKSATRIQEEQMDQGNDEMTVIIRNSGHTRLL